MFSCKIYFICLFILFQPLIKTERWWSPIKGYDITDFNEGYSGTTRTQTIDFYLCDSRNYQVHYLDDDKDTWSKNFSNC